jgi:transcriptional regulator with XRE-family HTH domain
LTDHLRSAILHDDMTGHELKQRREAASLTQSQLADLLGVSFTTVNRWENEKSPILPSMEKLINYTLAEGQAGDTPTEVPAVHRR